MTGSSRFNPVGGTPGRSGSALQPLLLAIVIVGLVATVAWPTSARSSDQADAERVVGRVRADMEDAFSRAGMRGRPITIQFDPLHLHYDIRDAATGELLAEHRFAGAGPHGLRSMWVSRGRITVDANGEASYPYWIRLGWGHGDHRWLLVHRTGRIRTWGWR